MISGLNHAVSHAMADSGIEVDRETKKQFKALVRQKNYQAAFDLINNKYNLDADIKGKYTLSFVESDKFDGLTGGGSFKIQEVKLATDVFKSHVAKVIRVVHHEFVHVYQRGVLGMVGTLANYEVREFLAFHDALFNNKLPKASSSDMEWYWTKAKTFFNYIHSNPTLIREYQSQYNDYVNSGKF